jgi:hypothetical protein
LIGAAVSKEAMEAEEIVSRLRSCLAESVPEPPARRALAEALRAWAAPDKALAEGLGEVCAAIEQSSVRRELAIAAARAMRLIMQAEPAPNAAAAEPVLDARARRRGRAQRAQAHAVAGDDARAPVEERPVECLPGV